MSVKMEYCEDAIKISLETLKYVEIRPHQHDIILLSMLKGNNSLLMSGTDTAKREK